MRRTATFLLALAAGMAGIAHAAPPAMQTVESVDLKRYAGMWYCLLYTSPSPRDVEESRMPSSA